MSRWQPKTWPAPKSRRTRNAYDALDAGWSVEDDESVLMPSDIILKDAFPDLYERPRWAKLARKHGWLTESAYYAVPQDERINLPPMQMLWHREMNGVGRSFLSMLRIHTDFTGGDT